MRKTLLLLLAIAGTLLASSSHADIDRKDERGYGDKYGRAALSWSVANGNDGTHAYIQQGLGFDLDVMGYFEKTHFDTLIGTELGLSVGVRNLQTLNDPTVSDGGNYSLFARAQAAMDFSFLHWDGSVPGRFVIGGGGGIDWDDQRWYGKGRAYPMIVGRFQLRPSKRLRVHFGYHFLPMTSADGQVQEHRFELAVGMKGVQAGIRHQFTGIVPSPGAEKRHEQQSTFFLSVGF